MAKKQVENKKFPATQRDFQVGYKKPAKVG